MAILQLDDLTHLTDPSAIADVLFPLGIDLRSYRSGNSLHFPDLLAQDVLTHDERQQILGLHDSHFEFLKQQGNYAWCDLLTLHPGSLQLPMWATTYGKYHVHSDPEALYVLAGEVIFGFVTPEGNHLQLLLQPQDFLHISPNVEHWSSLGASLTLKVVHYFSSATGWVPRYTGTRLSETLGI
jgi:1,2-dihydroxy-3-keto-5-methylthiopentene dioxygenase